ncbi:MAG: diguanylate cyclase [Deltaproteobacteria bacterium]|nr:diguanylate cyclase [Deltaproteobacteria bacterium]
MRPPSKTAPEGHRTARLVTVGGGTSSLPPAPDVAVLVVLTGPQLGERVRLVSRVEIGRDPSAGLRLRDPHVGPRHLAVEPTARLDRWRVIDLGAGATHLDGRALAPHTSREIATREEIRVGDTLLRVEVHGEVEQEFDRVVVERLHKDDLTGLYSRRKFEDELATRLEHDDEPLVLALLDVDGVKRVNDAHGHLAGAAVIAHVGRTIARTLGSRGLAARLGGDEIAILFALPLTEAIAITESLLDAVRFAPCVHEEYRHAVTVSAGIADRRGDAGLIMRAADSALLEAKRRGGDRVNVAQ